MKFNFINFPYMLWITIFVVIPLFLIIIFAFSNYEYKFTLENIINTGKYSGIFLRSIFLGAISTIICLMIGYPMGYFASKLSVNKQSMIITALMVPMWMSFLLRTYAWMTILENNGLLNMLLNFLGFEKINFINTQGAVIFGMIYNFLPYMILPIYSILTKIDKKLIEAAQDLGANKIKVFTKIILPLSMPGIISGITMVFVPAVSTFIISKMLGGGSNLLIGDLIEMQFLGSSYNPHLGSAVSLVLMIIIMLCIGIMNQFDNKKENDRIII